MLTAFRSTRPIKAFSREMVDLKCVTAIPNTEIREPSMCLAIKEYSSEHAEAFRELHRACLAHYAMPAATRTDEDRILSLMNAERHMACHLAFQNEEPVGFATWGLNFPAGAGISLVMKELFVIGHARGQGIGRAIFSALIDTAEREGCARFDWSTDGTNSAAQAFYNRIGAPRQAKQAYRVLRDEFLYFQRRL